MPRGSRPGERRGGRKPGVLNKATRDIQERARAFVEDAVAVAHMRKQYQEGRLPPQLVQMFHAYAYGKPKERVEVSGPDGQPITAKVVFEVIGG